MRSLAVWLGFCFACGATPPAATGSASESASPAASESPPAAGPSRAARTWPDAGIPPASAGATSGGTLPGEPRRAPDDPVLVADAGMADLGIAECDALLTRIIACPGFALDEKQSLVNTHEGLRQQALTASPGERASLAAMCRETARQFEEFLLAMSC